MHDTLQRLQLQLIMFNGADNVSILQQLKLTEKTWNAGSTLFQQKEVVENTSQLASQSLKACRVRSTLTNSTSQYQACCNQVVESPKIPQIHVEFKRCGKAVMQR